MEAGNFLWKSELSSLTVKYGSEQNVGVNLQQTRLCLHTNVFMCRFMNIIWTRFPPKRWLEMEHGPKCSQWKTHCSCACRPPRADSISISLLLHYNCVPHNVIHTISLRENSTIVNSASLRDFNVRPDGFPEINIFKVTQQIWLNINLEVPTAEINDNSDDNCLVHFRGGSPHKIHTSKQMWFIWINDFMLEQPQELDGV